MKYLPVSLNIKNKKVLVVGGGKVALQKINVLLKFTPHITVIAKDICDGIKEKGLKTKIKAFKKSDLIGFYLVYACTNLRKLNASIKKDANKLKCLVNVADDPELCDFIMPAIFKKGYMSVAVSSDGQNVKKSVQWRGKIKAILK